MSAFGGGANVEHSRVDVRFRRKSEATGQVAAGAPAMGRRIRPDFHWNNARASMAIHRLTESLSGRLQQMERSGRLKGRESVVVAFVPSKEGRGPRFRIEDEGDKLFLRMNSNSYLGMALPSEIVEAEERAAIDYG